MAASVTPPRGLLEQAWSFASAITNDEDDRAKAQAEVVTAWIEAGEPLLAAERAGRIAGWRSLAGIADASASLALRGQTNEAARLLLEAEFKAPGISGWPYDRVLLRVAHAKAYLGRRADLELLAKYYADHREHRGIVQTALAIDSLRAGRTDEALAAFDRLPEPELFDAAVARASGLRELAAAAALPPERRRDILQRAWTESEKVAGWRRVDLQFEVVDEAHAAGASELERAWLRRITDEARAAGFPELVRAGHLARAAVGWGRLGDTGTVAALETDFRAGPQKTIELIMQPEPLSLFAEANRRAGDHAKSDALFAEAFDVAAALVNPRPRALACVDVLLAMARACVPPTLLEEKRRAALAGFNHRVP